ncbi:pseudouridine synthase [Litorihabitans aurantiacus]|uniref:Pseudouridine synthase n=2 Tax=Litorihabitans aurantiacus TaxID=1930061 RepID=A0AA37UTZ9_9MICO|nr:pseudouridine synthase [Litorihabitans aurantiacus]
MAAAGVGSRRVSEDYIAAGRVSVNGEVVTEPGRRVDPSRDVVHVDGLRVQLDADHLTLVLNKPLGVLSAMSDDRGRPTLEPYVTPTGKRLYHVGRLDSDTDGLLLLTNDGELAHRLAHPSYEVSKVYVAEVRGDVARGVSRRLRDGVDLEDGPARADRFTVLQNRTDASVVQIQLHEGRNRIVRRMLEAVGHPVTRLTRTAMGPIRLGQLRPGQTRAVTGSDLGELMKVVGL